MALLKSVYGGGPKPKPKPKPKKKEAPKIYDMVVECKYCAESLKIPSNINKFQCAKCHRISEIDAQDMELLKSVYGGGPKPKPKKKPNPKPPAPKPKKKPSPKPP